MIMEKTLAMKVLEGKKVAYEVVTYSDTERDAVQVAQALGISPSQLFKTLVVTRPSGKPLLVMLPGDRQLDLKRLAQAVGEKRLKMATHQEAEGLTGLQVGGISALALLHRPFVFYLDTAARDYSHIYVSAGKRGINLKVAVQDLVKVTGARWVG
jgi:Cys-tRNA(Pro)/Cys-tRNA(Cys) deacylase